MVTINVGGIELELNYENLLTVVKSGDVVALILDNKRKLRLFYSKCGHVCYYKQGSKRVGTYLYGSQLEHVKRIVYKDTPEVFKEKLLKKNWNIIDKYRRYGEKTWCMLYGQKCAETLPKTRQQWEADGCKSLYEYGITMGCAKDGQVITLEAIGKEYPHLLTLVRDAISNKREFISGILPFRGYDMSIKVKKAGDGNENHMLGYLSMEFKGCANGHYYLMINEDCFIYYDKD